MTELEHLFDLHNQLYEHRKQLLAEYQMTVDDYELFIAAGNAATTEQRAAMIGKLMWNLAGDQRVLNLTQEIYRTAGVLDNNEFKTYMYTLQQLDSVKRLEERHALETMVARGITRIENLAN